MKGSISKYPAIRFQTETIPIPSLTPVLVFRLQPRPESRQQRSDSPSDEVPFHGADNIGHDDCDCQKPWQCQSDPLKQQKKSRQYCHRQRVEDCH